jgi:HAD superfamily phosphoserine phosphatase-like hydrolase
LHSPSTAIDDRGRDPRQLAVFDLDGTITRRDTFLAYLHGWLRRHPERGHAWSMVVPFWNFLVGGRDRGLLKSRLIRRFMAGATRAEVADWSGEFVAGLADSMLCPGALAAIERHRRAGDRLVLLSASVDLYVPQVGARFGFDETICTGISWRGGLLDGSLTTPNRRASEKRNCIETLRARFPGIPIAAYANSGSDLVHLRAVERPMLVNAGLRARRAARRLGIPVEDWRNKRPAAPVQSGGGPQ